MLDSSGEVLDVLYTAFLTLRSQNVNDQQRKKNDQRLLKFMTDHQPHAVVLGAVNLSCTRLKDDIYEIIFKMVEENPRDVGHEMDKLSIVYGDESLPRFYENCRISSDQLPGQSGIVKRAVALGRFLQNPSAMVLVDVTNQVGLDVNLAASHEWLFAPLQFISGLGPRKAALLQRIYLLAQELAKDVYDKDFEGDNNEEDAFEMAIEHVRDRPSLLKSLRLDNYLQSKDRKSKGETFYDIRRELIQGFQDWRKQYKGPSQDEEFFMISGKTDGTLVEGRIVQATIHRVRGGRAICVLESGLTGMIMKEDYADDWRNIIELSDRLHEGDILTCKIKSIKKNRYQVFLVCKDSEMRNNRYQHIQNLDPYYHEEQSSLQCEQEKARKEKELAKKHFELRRIAHSCFKILLLTKLWRYVASK
ncbi:hypothetical protein DITRI_Ditri02bG0112900 [Diplodiscus trichospermus]